ncbi:MULTISPECIES: UPF0489 family protein [Enterobacter]|uniref:UPF0489 family protein n=1 Tax=Enterobacter TaxID=547 RepID=UPI00066734D0|nr:MULTISPECIES: UPF0489 family protein [Enterobacter]ELF1030574.1 UPF0489 family protein [Enterobacter kobei]ELR7562769.1 UPF0489 family protein [Enterobacter kobei]MBA7750647.1 UPF0489 family protein [Enterobacter sp. RHBSTW-01064]MCK7002420.1 UPF0489 family protein [Enterobacter kobei]CZW55201.1 UPF0489 domain [Enterobacter kobei]
MNWLIPLNQKSTSGAFNVNFLVEENGIYISDNHRTALWCWMQHLKPNQDIALFHIDRHYDTFPLHGPYAAQFPGVFNLNSLKDYLGLTVKSNNQNSPLIRWDNYLSYFISDSALQNHIAAIYFATHKDGTYPNNPFQHCFENVEPYELLEDLESAINNHEKIIINIDLDYFFTDKDEKYFRFIDTKFIQNLFKILNEGMKTKKITCMTICLSPECCGDQNGNWSNSESVLQIAKTELGLNFIL